MLKRMSKVLRFSGLLGGFGFLVTAIVSSIVNNSWFEFYKHSFSSLGSPRSIHPMIYNIGMYFVGAMIILYAISFLIEANKKYNIIGATSLLFSGVFLIFVGIFHMGTRPHNFVSAWFFAQTDISLAIFAVSWLIYKMREWIAMAIILAFELFVAYAGVFPSVATIEAFGIFMIFMMYVVCLTVQVRYNEEI